MDLAELKPLIDNEVHHRSEIFSASLPGYVRMTTRPHALSNMVVIKVTFPESVRRINIPNAVEGYAALKKCIQQEIGGAAHRINYTDKDGDHVTIGSYDEFSLAIDENTKHFKVTFTAVTTTAVSSGGKSSQGSTCLSANSSMSDDADGEEAASEEPGEEEPGGEPGEEPGDEQWEEIENESEKGDSEPQRRKIQNMK